MHRDDWKEFAREIRYPVHDEFYYFAEDPSTGLADAVALESRLRGKLGQNAASSQRHVSAIASASWCTTWSSRRADGSIDGPRRSIRRRANQKQGPAVLRIFEKPASRRCSAARTAATARCRTSRSFVPNRSVPRTSATAPAAARATASARSDDFECIWSRAYDRLKYEGREQDLLDHAPVIQDESLRGTSSWANALLERDHNSERFRRCDSIPIPLVTRDQADRPSLPENLNNDNRSTSQVVEPAAGAASQSAL